MSGPEDLIPELDRALDSLERRDLDGFMHSATKHIDVDCEFTSGIGSVVGGGVYRGHQGIQDWFGELLETADELHWRERNYEAVGETVLLFLARLELTGAASQAPVSSEVGAVYEFEGGLCTKIVSYTSYAEARAAAEGLHV